MARTIACRVDPSSVVELFPLHVTKDGNDYVIGRHGARSYLAVSEVALDAVMLLSRHVPVGEVKEQLARLHDVESVSIAPLLEQLLGAGLVRAIDGEPIDEQSKGPAVRRSVLTRARVAPLFGRTALTVYALVLGGGLLALIDARGLPHFTRLIADRSIGMLLLSFAVVAVMTAKHEFAHIAAGKFLGVDARWRMGHRLMFPVVETDLSDLWTIAPNKRYLAYGAGMVSDVLVGALALMLTGLDARGWIVLSAEVHRVCDITMLVALVALVWQCNVFLRTDGYYMLATALGSRNLAGDAKAYLRDRRQSFPRSVRLFALGYAATVAVLSMSWLFGLSVILRSDAASGNGRAIGLAIGLALLIAGMIAERRRAASRYRLVCPVGLSLALALIASSASADQLPGPSYGNFLWNGFRDVHARSLTAIHAEVRRPLVASSLAAAAFGRVAGTGRGGSSGTGVYREAGVGLRLFDNAPFAMQIDWPLVVDGPGVDDMRAFDARRVVVRLGRVFERR